MVQDVPNTFDIETDRLSSSFYITNDIVVEGLRHFRLKQNFNFGLALWIYDSADGFYSERITPLHLTFDGIFLKWEGERNVF